MTAPNLEGPESELLWVENDLLELVMLLGL